MKKIYLPVILCSIAMAGCMKELTLDINAEVKPVLNALLQRDSLVTATVTISALPNSPPGDNRRDAVVKVYENGAYLETLEQKGDSYRSRYVGKHRLKEGAHYRLTAEVPGFPMVEGEDVIPTAMSAFSATLEKRPANGAVDYYIQLKLNDPAGERNYYRVRLFAWHDYNNGIEPSRSGKSFSYEGPEFWDLYQDEENVYEFVFDDAMFGGRIRQLPFKVRDWGWVKRFEVEVSQLSRDAFLYLQTVELQRIRGGKPFAEKVTVHNNIRGGLGIVGGMAIGLKEINP